MVFAQAVGRDGMGWDFKKGDFLGDGIDMRFWQYTPLRSCIC